MREVNVKVNLNAIKERYKAIAGTTDAYIMPVLKNNCNGLGFEKMVDFYSEFCPRIATSYAYEWTKIPDHKVEKFSWIWYPDEVYTTIKNLILVCKEWKQLEFCIENNIKFFIEFNVGMNRGGFEKKDIPVLREKIGKRISVMTHCPYEDEGLLKIYKRNVNKLLLNLEKNDFILNDVTCANSYCTKTDHDLHYTMCRCGELLFLPHNDKYGKSETVEYSTYLAHITNVKAGDWVGYHMVQLRRDTKVGILPIGYYHFEVENLKYVKIRDKNGNYRMLDVICSMHDTTVVELPKDFTDSELGDKVILLDLELQEYNWNRCIQKTFKINQDMVNYTYTE